MKSSLSFNSYVSFDSADKAKGLNNGLLTKINDNKTIIKGGIKLNDNLKADLKSHLSKTE